MGCLVKYSQKSMVSTFFFHDYRKMCEEREYIFYDCVKYLLYGFVVFSCEYILYVCVYASFVMVEISSSSISFMIFAFTLMVLFLVISIT